MDQETKLALELKAELQVLIEKYKAHDHLTGFLLHLEDAIGVIDASLEDIEGVE